MKYPILFDCDPGIDDAVAFALAAAHSDVLDIRGITSVAGNQTIERVTGNALKLTAFLGMDIPVARGSKAPLLREIIPAGDHMERPALATANFRKQTGPSPVNRLRSFFIKSFRS